MTDEVKYRNSRGKSISSSLPPLRRWVRATLTLDGALTLLVSLCGITGILVLVLISAYIVLQGARVISLAFLFEFPRKMGREGGILPMIVTTFAVMATAMGLTLLLGLGSAIYLAEYGRSNRVTKLLRFGIEVLAGIPSILFGMFGFVFLVVLLRFGWSILSGSLTLAFMLSPTVARISEEALRSIPREFREEALVAGATRWKTIQTISLPLASRAIIGSLALAIGRAVGETAALILTVGSAIKIPMSLFDSARPMSIHILLLAKEGISTENCFGTVLVLFSIVTVIDFAALWLTRRQAASASEW
jgi:phosphate transport system permease protein